MALPTRGRVTIDTTAGEIDIELWSKETPKTCRNFLALAMEGYYDGVIFHRIVPGFLAQTGDRTGTGAGGESFFGEPFEDEIHPRLRFAHRGLVAMANNGIKDSNDSQFFITLDRADELHGKHTLFGRVIGDTIFNVLKIGECEIDSDGRPVYPPKIRSVRIVDNPFDDIVPRITAEEKRAQRRAKEQAQRERELAERRKGAKKNVKLLSFGAEEEYAELDESSVSRKKPMYRSDLVGTVPMIDVSDNLMPKPNKPVEQKAEPTIEVKQGKVAKKDDVDITKIREQHAKAQEASSIARQAQIEKMEAEIRKLSKRQDNDSDDEFQGAKKPKRSHLGEELAKYSKGRGLHKKGKDGRRRDESGILVALESFRDKLRGSTVLMPGRSVENEDEDEVLRQKQHDTGEQGAAGVGDPGIEVDDDKAFMAHFLHFPKNDGEEINKAERDYEVIDPRQRGARAKEEERERRRAQKPKLGGSGRYRRS